MAPDPSKLLIVDKDAVHKDASDKGAVEKEAVASKNGDDLSRRLAHSGYSVEVARSALEALYKIRRSKYDLVLLDQSTPGTIELDLLRLLRATYSPSELPVIVVTAADQGDSAAESRWVDSWWKGANDYVRRPAGLSEVAARIETQLSQAKNAHRLMRVDPLTGLGNRTALLERLGNLLAETPGANRGAACVATLDLDGFRRLNDSLGDSFGNDILMETARRVRDAVQSVSWADASDIARIGDDEFAVIGPLTGRDQMDEVAAAILQRLNRPLVVEERRLALSASVGIAADNGEMPSAEGLLRDAHLAMERARKRGGNRCELFDKSLREDAQERSARGLELRDALEQNRLSVVYQPKIVLQDRRVDGFEALLRWRRANGQDVPPMEFIPIAEETGLMQKIGVWVLGQACRQLASWQQEFPSHPPITMNVNVSVKQLADFHLVDEVRDILAETGLAPETLKLELTESSLLFEVESARDVLEALRALHVGLKLDDFGTGYSSLAYLPALHFDSLKIARCFVSKLGGDRQARAIVESIINLAHALNMNVVAEGIETEEQLRELEELGCDLGQGFLFHKPLDRVSAEMLLQRSFTASSTSRGPAHAPAAASSPAA